MAYSHLDEVKAAIERSTDQFAQVLTKSLEQLIMKIKDLYKNLQELSQRYETVKGSVDEIPKPQQVVEAPRGEVGEAPTKPMGLTST